MQPIAQCFALMPLMHSEDIGRHEVRICRRSWSTPHQSGNPAIMPCVEVFTSATEVGAWLLRSNCGASSCSGWRSCGRWPAATRSSSSTRRS